MHILAIFSPCISVSPRPSVSVYILGHMYVRDLSGQCHYLKVPSSADLILWNSEYC